MKTQLLTNPAALDAIAPQWDALANGEPMRSHAWLASWWRHYHDASRGELHVVAVVDHAGEQLIGLAPWRINRSFRRGVTIRWLGDGEVCTDHPRILAAAGFEDDVAQALAEHLTTTDTDWQLLELADVDQGEPMVRRLCEALAERGSQIERLPAGACWRLDLPGDWEALLAMQSKSHRKQLRRAERSMQAAGVFEWREVKTLDEWRCAWPIFRDLHQRRRQSLGEPGCFASRRWAAFHEDVSQRLLERGQLRLFLLEQDGKPLTAEYLFAGREAWRAYQGGLDPDHTDIGPGRLSLISLLQQAIAEGVTAIDFMRGDEEYKPHWRAEPHPTEHVRAVPPRLSAQLRNQAGGVARQMRGAARAGMRALGPIAVGLSALGRRGRSS